MTHDSDEGEGTEFVYSNDAGTMGVVQTTIESGGAPGDSTVVASTGNSSEAAEASNDNGSDFYVDPMDH